ncbi:hypothetical protein [Mucilaginibacter sp. UYCu711]|uniref:hypothetical protein n=1 Tax=Mucilaginibacter sp. UYCu711 TaxID=3156339 RepID=UPI003D24DA10
MKRFIMITMVILLSAISFTYAQSPCCNNKIHCSKCMKSCTKPNCLDYCSKSCKASGECKTKCAM